MPYLTFADASGLADLLRQNGVTEGLVLPDDTAFFHDAADFQTTTRFDSILGALDTLELQGIVVNQAHSWLKQWVETLREFAIDPESGQNWLPSAERSSLSKRLSDLWAWAQSDPATFGAVTGIASKLALPYQSEGYFNLYWGQQANPALM